MTEYNYNIRCKVCGVGFNPKNKQNALMRLCSKCFKFRQEAYKESRVAAS